MVDDDTSEQNKICAFTESRSWAGRESDNKHIKYLVLQRVGGMCLGKRRSCGRRRVVGSAGQLALEWDWAFRSVTSGQRPGGLKKDRGKPLTEACGAHLK